MPKNDAFELWFWKRLLRVSWTARRSNQSILKEIRPGCSLEGLMLKLKLQYFGHLMLRADSFEKTLMLGKIKGRKRRGQQRMIWLDGITNSMDMGLGKLWQLVIGRPGVLRFMGSQRVGTTERLNWNWTELNLTIIYKVSFPFMRKPMHWFRIRKTIQILSVYTCLEIRTLTILLIFWQISNSDPEGDGHNGISP